MVVRRGSQLQYEAEGMTIARGGEAAVTKAAAMGAEATTMASAAAAATEAAPGRAAGEPPPKPADWGTMTKGQKQHWYKRAGRWR